MGNAVLDGLVDQSELALQCTVKTQKRGRRIPSKKIVSFPWFSTEVVLKETKNHTTVVLETRSSLLFGEALGLGTSYRGVV